MNIAAVPGSSSRAMVGVYGPGTDDRLVKHFHDAYAKSARASGIRQTIMRAEHFCSLMDTGNIVVYVVMTKEKAQCVFGLQLMHDAQGEYLSFLFIYGFAARHMPLIIETCFQTWYAHRKLKNLRQEGRLLIVGRRAWSRVLSHWDIEFTEERPGKYWVYEYQKGRMQ